MDRLKHVLGQFSVIEDFPPLPLTRIFNWLRIPGEMRDIITLRPLKDNWGEQKGQLTPNCKLLFALMQLGGVTKLQVLQNCGNNHPDVTDGAPVNCAGDCYVDTDNNMCVIQNRSGSFYLSRPDLRNKEDLFIPFVYTLLAFAACKTFEVQKKLGRKIKINFHHNTNDSERSGCIDITSMRFVQEIINLHPEKAYYLFLHRWPERVALYDELQKIIGDVPTRPIPDRIVSHPRGMSLFKPPSRLLTHFQIWCWPKEVAAFGDSNKWRSILHEGANCWVFMPTSNDIRDQRTKFIVANKTSDYTHYYLASRCPIFCNGELDFHKAAKKIVISNVAFSKMFKQFGAEIKLSVIPFVFSLLYLISSRLKEFSNNHKISLEIDFNFYEHGKAYSMRLNDFEPFKTILNFSAQEAFNRIYSGWPFTLENDQRLIQLMENRGRFAKPKSFAAQRDHNQKAQPIKSKL